MPAPPVDPHRITRRALLTGAGAAATLLATGARSWAAPAEIAGSDLFTLGVASGDPRPDGVLLWTRLAPEPLDGGGMPDRAFDVEWELATDELFRQVVRRGRASARAELGHAVHVAADGLEPARWYWYRFRCNGELSRPGRTRTAPAAGSTPDRIRFAFASCQSYTAGYYAAYRHMAAEDLDLVVHLGDYIYESGPNYRTLRRHSGRSQATNLREYRNRYAQYRTDPYLQAVHAAFPFAVIWDDHELDGNWADEIPQRPSRQGPQEFRRRRERAFRAYYEHMPLRPSAVPRNLDLRLYRRFSYGDLATFHLLDGRQYRSDQVCVTEDGPNRMPDCAARYPEERSMLGAEQERWLADGLLTSRARWNVLANQTMLAPFDFDPSPTGRVFGTDQWDGYPAARRRLLDVLASGGVANPVVISGDSHAGWVNELRPDVQDPASPIVGTEFVGPSITSDRDDPESVEVALASNPQVRFFDGRRRGYVRCEITPEQWRSDYRLLPPSLIPGVTVPTPLLPLEKTVSWVVPDGGIVEPG